MCFAGLDAQLCGIPINAQDQRFLGCPLNLSQHFQPVTVWSLNPPLVQDTASFCFIGSSVVQAAPIPRRCSVGEHLTSGLCGAFEHFWWLQKVHEEFSLGCLCSQGAAGGGEPRGSGHPSRAWCWAPASQHLGTPGLHQRVLGESTSSRLFTQHLILVLTSRLTCGDTFSMSLLCSHRWMS